MIDEFLQERAALYVSGTMSEREREQFELVLEFNDELREFTVGLAEIGAAVTLATQRLETSGPSPALKGRILEMVRDRPQHVNPEPLVVSGPGRISSLGQSRFYCHVRIYAGGIAREKSRTDFTGGENRFRNCRPDASSGATRPRVP